MIYVLGAVFLFNLVAFMIYGWLLRSTKQRIEAKFRKMKEKISFNQHAFFSDSTVSALKESRYFWRGPGITNYLERAFRTTLEFFNIRVINSDPFSIDGPGQVVFWCYIPIHTLLVPAVAWYLWRAAKFEIKQYVNFHKLDERGINYTSKVKFDSSWAMQHYIDSAASHITYSLGKPQEPFSMNDLDVEKVPRMPNDLDSTPKNSQKEEKRVVGSDFIPEAITVTYARYRDKLIQLDNDLPTLPQEIDTRTKLDTFITDIIMNTGKRPIAVWVDKDQWKSGMLDAGSDSKIEMSDILMMETVVGSVFLVKDFRKHNE